MKVNKRVKYCSPIVRSTEAIVFEAVMLSESARIESAYVIDGQETDGYFESGDISSVWE